MESKKIVTFDFDGTLSNNVEVQDYAKELIARGIEVWVMTMRYGELHKHLWKQHPTNEDLYTVCESIGIPKERIYFTCMEWKAEHLNKTKVLWHLDDSLPEIEFINDNPDVETFGILFGKDWKFYCEHLLKEN